MNAHIFARTNLRTAAAVLFAAAAILLATAAARAQESAGSSAQSGASAAPGGDVSDIQRETEAYPEAAKSANEAMSMSAMEMNGNPHMFMTELHRKQPGDDRRAQEIVEILGKSLAKYKDYKVAIADGYQIFLPRVPQAQYHFTNYKNAVSAAFIFNPAHPTSLLYKKTATGYELQGAMYTAPKNATEQQLNERVPLSVARWHEHVNFCMPPRSAAPQQVNWKEFGLAGSITTQDACAKANGRWVKQIFGWMVHVYPFESDPEKIWAH
jgi:hypothetical protein